MNEFLEELSRVELKPEEIEELLRRLAVDELGGSEHSSIGDVCELTGAAPEVVGRMLADIRGTPWEAWRKRIQQQVDSYALRIEQLESKPASEESDVELYERVQRGQLAATAPFRVGAAIVALIGVAVFAAMLAEKNAPHYDPHEWYPGALRYSSGGATYGYNGGCVWSQQGPDGKPGPVASRRRRTMCESYSRFPAALGR